MLWSRLDDYSQRWLDDLLAEGALFEYWSRAACLLPIEDYALYRRLMLSRLTWHEKRWRPWMEIRTRSKIAPNKPNRNVREALAPRLL